MTNNESLAENIRNYLESGVDLLLTDDDYRTIIKALEQEPCKPVGNSDKLDCISRELVINYLISEWHKELRDIIQDIRQLPSVALQEPKTGHWIEYTKVIIPEPFNSWKQAWKCSECGYGGQDDEEDGWLEWKYCPNCGCRMESEE